MRYYNEKISHINSISMYICYSVYRCHPTVLLSDRILETDETLNPKNLSVSLFSIESEEAFSDFSVDPLSWDFGTRCVEQLIPATFNFEVKNNGIGTENGSVQNIGSAGFTCVSGCSYSLGAFQTQHVTIQFEPPSTGPFSATPYFTHSSGAVQVSLSGEGTWDIPPCPRP